MTDELEIDGNALAPELRAIGRPSGIPITIAGETWLLAFGGCATVLDAHRDRLDDKARLDGAVNFVDVLDVARFLLMSNYELSDLDVVTLLTEAASTEAGRDELASAVMASLFGGDGPKTYSQWMMTSLYAAGLDPDKIPPEWIPGVLDQLVATRRAVPIGEYTDAAIAAPRIRAAKERAARHAERKVSEAPADEGSP